MKKKSQIQHHYFQSSRVDEGWFDPSKREITLLFPDGVKWWYRGCDQDVWNDLKNSMSAGSYLASNLNFFRNGKVS